MCQSTITSQDFTTVKDLIRKWWYVIRIPYNHYDIQYNNMYYMVNLLLSGHTRKHEVLLDMPHDLLQRLHISDCL